MSPRRTFLIGIAATLAFSALWHGPLGANVRFAAKANAIAQRTLTYYEMDKVTAATQQDPTARRILLTGPGNDFQRSELVRIMNDVPGILDAAWTNGHDAYTVRHFIIPSAIEAQLLGLASFAFGMIIAYLHALRRRANRYKKRI